MDLALDDERVDQPPRVAGGDVVDDLDPPGLALDVDDGHVHPAREGWPRRQEIVRGLEAGAHAFRQRRAGRARERELAEREPAVRSSDDADDSVGELEIALGDLEPMRGQAARLLRDGPSRDERGAAGHDGVTAGVGPDAERDHRGVAVPHGHLAGLDPELVRHHLRQRRRRSLAVRRGARDEQRVSSRIHTQHRALVRPEPGEQHVGGDSDAQQAAPLALGALRGLLGAAVGIAGQGQRGVEGRLVVAAVVDHRDLGRRDPELPRELVATDEILSADLGRIHPELVRQPVESSLDGEDGLGLAGAAVGGRRRLARERRANPARVVADPVRSGQAGGGDRRAEHPEAARVRAGIREQLGAHPDDRPVATRRELDVVPLLARMRGVRQVLVTRLDPLHRRGEAHRQEREQDLLRVDLLLHAESAAHVGRDHANLVLGQPEHLAERVAQGVGPLGGRPHGETARAAIVVGQDPAGLEWHPGVAMDVVASARHDLGRAKRTVRVAGLHDEIGGDVARNPVVQECRARSDGGVRVGHDVERLVGDLQGLDAILGRITARGHHRDGRLADVAHLLARQRKLPARSERRMVDDAGDLAEAALRRQVGRREHAGDVRDRARGIRVDPEARVRVDAARERHVEGSRQAQVVDIEGLAAQ